MASVRILIAAAILALAASSAQALQLPKISVPKGAEARAAAFGRHASPKVRAFVAREGAALAKSKSPSQAAARAAIQSAGFGKLSEGDINALAFVVLAQAADDQMRDLQTVMAGIKSTHGRGPIPAENIGSAYTLPSLNGDSWSNDISSIEGDLKSRLDAMNEMSEMTSMRLQMAMDRESKLMEALSNLLKDIDNTSDAILQNMK
ncbi:MAG TPA: hypothetical protein VGL66_07385 [Caulobacteraceae bacterium]|jgi:hypothetical protein